ncbi:Mlo-related protein [Cynara cardunculus var. scolymus]|uniref:Mlo-related protein n=1 Tax=Cynara cardunculus var. scolymus TaxID=59895 RepID=A0A103XNN4_CYNCS|nr:Mlo-related protein [Cynara cardunculus var. scolymus]
MVSLLNRFHDRSADGSIGKRLSEKIILTLQKSRHHVKLSNLEPEFTHVRDHDFIKNRFLGLGKRSAILGWLQFYGSVTKTDYAALRLGFITLLFFVGTKLEHIIIQLAHEVAEKHVAIEGEVAVKPSDDHFWFRRPRIILLLIHFILFQNAFEIAFFFWILVQFGLDSCIMGKLRYMIPRLVIGVFIQVLCSYSTLPLYALVTQMGSHFKKSIFEERIQTSLTSWAQKAKRKKALNVTTNGSSQDGPDGGGGGGSSGVGNDGVELQSIHIINDPPQSTNR